MTARILHCLQLPGLNHRVRCLCASVKGRSAVSGSEVRQSVRISADISRQIAIYVNEELLVTSVSTAFVRYVSTDRLSALIPRW